MLAVALKILSILGIILLSLLGIFLVVLLLVLFVPISYRMTGHKNELEMVLKIRMNWLFRLLRASFDYPEPGVLKVKALFFTLYESSGDDEKHSGMAGDAAADEEAKKEAAQETEKEAKGEAEIEIKEEIKTEAQTKENPAREKEEAGQGDASFGAAKRIFSKIEKLKYTIRTICDRIKEIRENISYYKRLWEREETRELFRHAFMRIGKVLKSIRPRRLNCRLVYGAESPDATGYLYAVYGMLCPCLGNSVNVVPDFTQAIFEGEVDAAGYITVFQVAWNALMLLLDKRLHLLRRRLKAHKAALERKKKAA